MLQDVLKYLPVGMWMARCYRQVWFYSVFAAVVIACAVGPRAGATTIGDLGRVTAKAAIVVDNETGQVLFARNPNMPLPPASTTKLVTAMVAIQGGHMDEDVRVSKRASRMQPTKIWLKPGWTMNVRDLVYAMMLRSANDASVAVAEGIGGSVTSFARKMNETVKALGGKNSNFVNPNGLPARGHYSTAADLARVVNRVLLLPEMRAILSTRTKKIRPRRGSRRQISLKTTNKLLGKRNYRLIGKTGYTRAAKRCFAGAASLPGREVLVVVLGSKDLWGDLELLVDYGLKPAAPSPDWSEETGWRQALAPTPLPQAVTVKRSTGRPVAQGDRGGSTEEPRFRFHVQVASLRSKTIAEQLFRQVSERGYNAVIEPHRERGVTRYRVVVRDFADRVIARRVARELSRELRIETQIIAERG